MTERPSDDRRLCPTRIGGAHSLIAHWIAPATCLERQRRSYHKCFTCQYRGLAADVRLPGLLRVEEDVPAPVPASAPHAASPTA